jgi:hypothetical protein
MSLLRAAERPNFVALMRRQSSCASGHWRAPRSRSRLPPSRMIVSRCVSVIRSVERIELPSTKQLMIGVYRGSAGKRGSVHHLNPDLSLHLHYNYQTSLDLSIHLHYIFHYEDDHDSNPPTARGKASL